MSLCDIKLETDQNSISTSKSKTLQKYYNKFNQLITEHTMIKTVFFY